MTIADLIKELIDTSKERLKTPISGAFLWSFLIYNWRPIAVLFSSEAPIGDRIIVINDVYCKPHALWGPLVLAVFYIVAVPFIMWVFDWPIVYAKKIRITKSNESKKDILQGKIDISAKVNELKDAESGNKEKQDFLDQIKLLKEQNNVQQESIKQITESSNTTIEGINSSLKSLQESINLKEKEVARLTHINNLYLDNAPNLEIDLDHEYKNIIKRVLDNTTLSANLVVKTGKIADTLTVEDYRYLKKLTVNNKNEIIISRPEKITSIQSLIDKSVVVRNVKNGLETFVLTEAGSLIYEILVTDDKINRHKEI
jgi:hypothetical protein